MPPHIRAETKGGVTGIGDYAFGDCGWSLREVFCSGTAEQWSRLMNNMDEYNEPLANARLLMN